MSVWTAWSHPVRPSVPKTRASLGTKPTDALSRSRRLSSGSRHERASRAGGLFLGQLRSFGEIPRHSRATHHLRPHIILGRIPTSATHHQPQATSGMPPQPRCHHSDDKKKTRQIQWTNNDTQSKFYKTNTNEEATVLTKVSRVPPKRAGPTEKSGADDNYQPGAIYARGTRKVQDDGQEALTQERPKRKARRGVVCVRGAVYPSRSQRAHFSKK